MARTKDKPKEDEKMMYKECPKCGAHLDFGERCDCEQERAKEQEERKRQIRAMQNTVWMPPHSNQYELKLAAGFNDR